MKKNILSCLLSTVAFSWLYAQQAEVRWSDKQTYDNSLAGFFQEFLEGNSKFIYARMSNYSRTKGGFKKIVAFDKKTMKEIHSATVEDKDKDPMAEKVYKDMAYYKTIVFENVVYIFWLKRGSGKEELFVQTFSSDLKPQKQLKKVYELVTLPKTVKDAAMLVMGNKHGGERILLGGELSAAKNEKVRFEYKLLNSDFSFASSHQVPLPVVATGNSYGLTSSYEFGDDGNLYIKTYVRLDKEERKKLKKGEASVYPVFTMVDLATANVKSYSMKFEDKNVFDFDFIADNNSLKAFGFFCDLNKDKEGNDTHGIFYTTIDNTSFQVTDMNFTYFTPTQLNALFTSDKEDRKDKKWFQSSKKAKSENESLASGFTIEDVVSPDKQHLVLFCSRTINYTVRTCDNKGHCTTRYYCEKRNVTVFKIGNKGEITWASNIDRKATYSGWDINDLRALKKGDKYYVTYGSDYFMKAQEKNFMSKKPKKYKRDRFEYAVLDNENGKFTRMEYQVNALNTKKENVRTITPVDVVVGEQNFFVLSSTMGHKAWAWVAGIAGCFCCPIIPWIIFNTGSARTGTGYLGAIDFKN